MIKKLRKYLPVTALLLAAFILRAFNIEELFHFTYDESIPAFVGRRLILWHHVPLIGGVTPFGFHLTPYFYWFLSGVLYLGRLNPIAWGYAGAIIAMATTYMMYVVGQTFSSKKVGFIAATFWAFSYLANIYDRHLWALYWGPLISLAVLFSLYKIIKGKQNFIYLLSITISLSLSADPSNLVFLLFTILVWIIYRLPFNKKTVIGMFIILFSFLPLAIFDLRHNFANTRPIANFVNQRNNKPNFSSQKFTYNSLIFPKALTRLVYTFGDDQISKQYSYCTAPIKEKFEKIPIYAVILITFIILVFVLMTTHRRYRSSPLPLISVLLVLYFLGIQLYGTILQADIFEHYITGTFSVFLLIAAFLLSKLPKKLWLFILAIFVAVNLYKLSIAQNSIGFKYKKQAIEFAMLQVGDRGFSLDSLSTCWRYSGYRYLFAAFGKEPVKSYVDPNFAYLYGTTPVAEKHPSTVVTFVIHDFAPETDQFYARYALLKSHEIKSALFGNIEVIIMDNSTGWFDKTR